jgi:hypothetical protein
MRGLTAGAVALLIVLSTVSQSAAQVPTDAGVAAEEAPSVHDQLAAFVADAGLDGAGAPEALPRFEQAIQSTAALAQSPDEGIQPAAVCTTQMFNDPEDRLILDGAVYGLDYDCDTRVWVGGALTYDAWFDDELAYFILALDTDANPATGCGGDDYHVVGSYDAGLDAGVARTPSCDALTWTVAGPAGIGSPSADFIAVAFDHAVIGSPTSMAWSAHLSDIYVAGEDAMPDSGKHTATVPGAPPQGPTSGYWMVGSAGAVYGFGAANVHAPAIASPTVAMTARPGGGYWVLTTNGAVHARNAPHYGNANPGQLAPGERFSSISARPQGDGYWIFTDRGRAIAFGAAAHFGDMAATPLNGPVIASTATASGNGYWMVGSDGGIFSFGDARFHGSMGGQRLNQPVVGIAPDLDGTGYWLVGADGGIFAFEANFVGSVPAALAPGQRLNKPVIGALSYGNGYLMVASDGGIFAFSDQPFHGSLGSTPPSSPIVGVAIWKA